jgi:hypothetical protein
MNTLLARWSVITLLLGLSTVLSVGCVVPGNGYGYDTSAGIGIDYYQPYSSFYGGWGAGYNVGPIYGNNYRPPHTRQTPHAYKPPPASRPVPSIPTRRPSDKLRLDHRNTN